MIDIEIQISISERSSGWATNYQVAEVTMSQFWWCKASDFFSFHLSHSFFSATIFCSKPSIVRPGGRRRGSSRALAGIPPPQPQPWQKDNSFDQWLKSPCVEYFNLSISMVNRKGAVCGSRRQGMHLRQWWFNWWQCEAATSGIFGGRKDPCFAVKSSCENLCCSSLFVKLQTNISRGSSLRYDAPS